MEQEEQKYLETGRAISGAVESQMFGKPCFKINGKAFVSFFNKKMVFKLTGSVHSMALTIPGAQLFDPSGKNRPMKEWVEVPFTHSDKWLSLAIESKKYVNQVQ